MLVDRLGCIDRDAASEEFFDSAAREILVLPRCEACCEWQPLTTQVCTSCDRGDLTWSPSSGRGRVVTWTALPDPDEEAGHRVMVMVELDEGPWLETRLVHGVADQVNLGMPVRIGFLKPVGGEPLPVALCTSPSEPGEREEP